MNKKALTILIVIFMSFSVGFLAATIMHDSYGHKYEDSRGVTNDMAESHDHGDNMHETMDVDAETAPELSINVSKDNKSGHNLALTTKNFKFTPENASSKHIDSEGHAHLYIDGKKINRLYGPNYFLGTLEKGRHEIRVTLNTNDHKDYTINGKVIEDTQTVIIK